jgi:ribonucleoside-triphosphate reductase (thioredoxin)
MDITSQILSDIVVHMKYARFISNINRRENWEEIVSRNKAMHTKKFPSLKNRIDEAYQYVLDKKILPSMRSMQFAGKPITLAPNRMFNCAYCPVDDILAFSEIMFLLLGGTGCGFSVQQHHINKLPEIRRPRDKTRRFLIGDSIEGWADAVKTLFETYFEGKQRVRFDFGNIRNKGSVLVTSGGKAPGPEPLKICLAQLEVILERKKPGEKLTSLEVYDLVCHIADAVLAGGIRRAALICLFSADDDDILSAKSGKWYELNPQRGRANNSMVLLRHRITRDKFQQLFTRIEKSGCGEPGIFFSNDKDWGTNPCVEIALRPFQFCNLVEVNTSSVKNQEDYNNRCRAASLIATLQASYTDFHYLRPIWRRSTEKEALIGVSMTGIASGTVLELDMRKAAEIIKEENRSIARIIGINPAARMTCVKPAGTTSLVLGTSSGIHAWHSRYYIRRIRVGKNESIYAYIKEQHPNLVEDDYFNPKSMAVISIPQEAPEGAITRIESAIELLERIKMVTSDWVHPGHISGQNMHNISATVSIKSYEWETVCEWMWQNRSYYNGLSVLPFDGGSYVQAPFEECTQEEYFALKARLLNINVNNIKEATDNTDMVNQVACAGGACEL